MSKSGHNKDGTFAKGNTIGNRFSSKNQPEKRGRKGKSISEYLKELGGANKVEFEIKVYNGGSDEPTIKKGKITSESTLNEVIATTLISKAMNGDLRAINIVIDRIEGKPNQPIELDLPPFMEMPKEERAQRLKELIQKAQQLHGTDG